MILFKIKSLICIKGRKYKLMPIMCLEQDSERAFLEGSNFRQQACALAPQPRRGRWDTARGERGLKSVQNRVSRSRSLPSTSCVKSTGQVSRREGGPRSIG